MKKIFEIMSYFLRGYVYTRLSVSYTFINQPLENGYPVYLWVYLTTIIKPLEKTFMDMTFINGHPLYYSHIQLDE